MYLTFSQTRQSRRCYINFVDSALAIVAEIEKEIAAKVALKFPPKPPAAVPVFDVTVTDHPLADVFTSF